MPNYPLAGFAHATIFFGFQVLLLNSVMLWGRGFSADFDFWGLLSTDHIVGQGYSLLKDIFAFLVILGTVVFFYLRLVKKGVDSGDPTAVKKGSRMTLSLEATGILGIIFTMMLADFVYVGAKLALEAHAAGTAVGFHWYEPIGSVFGMAFAGVGTSGLTVAEHVGFWWHSSFVLIFLNILPHSKHFHILTVFQNVFTHDRRANALPKVDDLEGRVERDESLGISKITDLTWNHILDLYTCTECGRCSDNCPAFITDKLLSPKHVTLALRNHLYSTEAAMFAEGDSVERPGQVAAPAHADGEPLHAHPPAPEGGYFENSEVVELLPHVLHPDVIWACTTCRACEEQCPVMISYVDKIVGMRREEVLIKGEFPPALQGAFNGLETNGNPWNLSAMDRGEWSDGLDVPTLADKPDASVLYWVGCAASYDDRAKKVARALVKLLKAAKVDFAILGGEENCTGDPARRAGNEYLFQMMAEQNVEVLDGYGAGKKTIVTACPHCLNTLANEYPDFGGHYDVVHHADFLNGLLVAGKLKPTHGVSGKVVYHDSCYLGRYNKIYDSPREVLEAIDGIELVEVPYWNKNKGLCCGAGQMFMEEQGEQRINTKRTLQLLDTGADTIASACPFCMTMLTDGLKEEEKEEAIAQRDLAEILVEACGLEADVDADAAE
ncbi:MAG: (Fe-S)-binding protein [Deltaproteobacteria bacterium]|nr:(Fe-S)-binding protein [Deltaproteobacteria bacterium]